jgi:hypothetical protein
LVIYGGISFLKYGITYTEISRCGKPILDELKIEKEICREK